MSTKLVHRTILVVLSEDDQTDIAEQAFAWEQASKTASRRVYRVEPALRGWEADENTIAWLVNLEVESPRASRSDLAKFVQSYVPSALQFYITE